MFPPIVDAGGFRPLAFARYLPEFGWDPTVLTRPDSGRLPLDPAQLQTLRPSVRVERVRDGFMDAWNQHFRKRLAVLRPLEMAIGKPAGFVAEAIAWRVARRDSLRQWEISWMDPAIEAGLKLIERDRPAAILATAPPFETLKAGWVLHQRTGLPLIADFRDPWTYGVLWNPATYTRRRARRELQWEATVVRAAAKSLVVTPSMQRTMKEQFPDRADRVELVMNGYEDLRQSDAAPAADRFVMKYVGSIMERRFPPVLFEALRRLRERHPDTAGIRVEFIGPNQCGFSLSDRIAAEGMAEVVEYLGPVGHDRGRDMMRSANVLLHIETVASYAVSSKLFEYFSAGRPILGIVPRGSDDEWFLHESGAGLNTGVDDPDLLAAKIYERWSEWRTGGPAPRIDEAWLKQFHRREQTRKLARLLDEAVAGTSG